MCTATVWCNYTKKMDHAHLLEECSRKARQPKLAMQRSEKVTICMQCRFSLPTLFLVSRKASCQVSIKAKRQGASSCGAIIMSSNLDCRRPFTEPAVIAIIAATSEPLYSASHWNPSIALIHRVAIPSSNMI